MKSIVKETENENVIHIKDSSTPPKETIQRQKNQAARQLLQEWLSDTSGYDEDTWPQVERMIEDNRLSPRNRFSD